MRTAITYGKTHDGKWEIIGSPAVPVAEQENNFRLKVLPARSHERFAEIRYQPSDAPARIKVLLSTKALAEEEARQAEFRKRQEEERKKSEAAQAERQEASAIEQAEQRHADVTANNEQIKRNLMVRNPDDAEGLKRVDAAQKAADDALAARKNRGQAKLATKKAEPSGKTPPVINAGSSPASATNSTGAAPGQAGAETPAGAPVDQS